MSTTARRGRTALTANDYTIGWYCSLPTPDLQASRRLLDEEHKKIRFEQSPRFNYIYGSMNGHNLVMATSPAGQIGMTTAAQVTFEMQTYHPRMKHCMLVGTGGAIPRPNTRDVRLGDVVVGVPDKERQHGGVIQFDFASAGAFQRIGSLNRPDLTLLSAVSMIESCPLSDSPFYEYLGSFENSDSDSDEEETPSFGRPMTDFLYPGHLAHTERETRCYCTGEFVVPRPPRKTNRPRVHYGTIASSNTVVNDSRIRDQVGEADGGILCLETEAAGAVNAVSTLVIRGICNYCDSHKQNDIWQPFAASAAAAFAKTVLNEIAPQLTPSILTEQLGSVVGFNPNHSAQSHQMNNEPSHRLQQPLSLSSPTINWFSYSGEPAIEGAERGALTLRHGKGESSNDVLEI